RQRQPPKTEEKAKLWNDSSKLARLSPPCRIRNSLRAPLELLLPRAPPEVSRSTVSPSRREGAEEELVRRIGKTAAGCATKVVPAGGKVEASRGIYNATGGFRVPKRARAKICLTNLRLCHSRKRGLFHAQEPRQGRAIHLQTIRREWVAGQKMRSSLTVLAARWCPSCTSRLLVKAIISVSVISTARTEPGWAESALRKPKSLGARRFAWDR